MTQANELPKAGYCRLSQIIGNKKAKPNPIPAIIPVSKAAWYDGVRRGKYPKPVHAGRLAMWRWADIAKLIEQMEKGELGD